MTRTKRKRKKQVVKESSYERAIKIAKGAADACHDYELRHIAFRLVLEHLLNTSRK